MKKTITLTALVLCLSAPVALTSCNDDDVQTVLNIVDQLFLKSNDELAGTAWLTADRAHGIEFGSGQQGLMADANSTTGEVDQRQFTYTVGSDGTSLTFTFTTGGSTTYTILAYEAKKLMTLRNNTTGETLSYNYYTE